MNNKGLCLKAINEDIMFLNEFKKGQNYSLITLMNPKHKSKYFLCFGFILCLISLILALLGMRIYVPKIMKYIFLFIGIVIFIVGIIVAICAKLKSPIPYFNLKNLYKKITYSKKTKISTLTKKLIVNNQYIANYSKYNDKDIKLKVKEYYKLLDEVYEDNKEMKEFIMEDLNNYKN